ncbi:MAG: hypothetical protein EP343_32595 [Deltaproteobacteria bacterium]|nr:MAG: hypothetical protein EP343_32595 [Deltaproteobacteria bacterium]
MRIGFDSSGAILHQTELPENAPLLMGEALMLAPTRGEVNCEILEGSITKGDLTLWLPTSEVQRMVEHSVAGLESMGNLDDDFLVELQLSLDLDKLGEHVSGFANVAEPLDLFYVTDGNYPVLLNLTYFNAVSLQQDIQSVEQPVEVTV